LDLSIIERIKAGMAFERGREAPPPGFPPLPLIPGGRYTDPGFLALEEQAIWKRSWLYLAHTGELPTPGSYVLRRQTGAPIIIVRGRDNVIRAFYNSCKHRGAPVVREDRGETRGFTCGYHGWTYDLDGRLVNLRDRRDFVDLDLACHGLSPVRCETFGAWIFVNEDPQAAPLVESLGPLAAELAQFQPEALVLVDSRAYPVACNVKVLLDAFLEVYHLKSIHQNTVDRFLDHRGTTITLWPGGHSRMTTPNRRPEWRDPGTIGMPEIPTVGEIARDNNVSYHIFPNIVMPPAPTGMPMLCFWPTGPRSMVIECHWFSPPFGPEGRLPLWDTRIRNFERILEEDTQFAPQIQESLESPGFRGMTLNYQERRIQHWHEELDRRIGPDRIPGQLRVPPVLADWVERA
jgi:phenylpropionate dioxygenase-like ring-hydroxylating dioxygenase large terminal subunit